MSKIQGYDYRSYEDAARAEKREKEIRQRALADALAAVEGIDSACTDKVRAMEAIRRLMEEK